MVTAATTAAGFVGRYSLISSTRVYHDGREEDLAGPPVAGSTRYYADGRMWVLIRLSGAKATHLVAYYGRYSVDPVARTVCHDVESSLDRRWLGQRLTRRYRFFGARLTLTVAAADHELRTTYERIADPFAADT